MDDAGLLGRERQPTSGEPVRQGLDHRLGVLFGLTKHAEIIGVAYEGAGSRDATCLTATDAERLFQTMQRHVRQQRTDHGSLTGSSWRLVKDALVYIPRL